MGTAKPLLDYGVLGIFCFILLAAVSALFWLGWKANRAYIKELKEDREFKMEIMRHIMENNNQAMINNNRVVENNNEMVKGFIDIASSFKALLNVFIDVDKRRGPKK